MQVIYNNILRARNSGEKLLAVLIDPDKMDFSKVSSFIEKVNRSITTHIFVGGSEVVDNVTDNLVLEIKKYTSLPIILFPGDITQLTDNADGLLFLSLLSGRNPEYLIGKHIRAVSILRGMNLEVIPTAYILVENGRRTAVQRVTQTEPLSKRNIQKIVDTAKAGELLGMKLIYLEAGSGALNTIDDFIISEVKKTLDIPLIVGGGIKTIEQLNAMYNAGADLVVIGTAFEEDTSLFSQLENSVYENIG